jgi:hypothetical protein
MGEKNVRMKLGWSVAGLLVLGVFLGAPQARAGDDFERGFKNELGRIAAREVVHVGRHVVADVVWGHRYYRPRAAHPVRWHYAPRRRAYLRARAYRPHAVGEYHYYVTSCEEHGAHHRHR